MFRSYYKMYDQEIFVDVFTLRRMMALIEYDNSIFSGNVEVPLKEVEFKVRHDTNIVLLMSMWKRRRRK